MKMLVTGSSGLIGSEICKHFDRLGLYVYGIDNNMRADFFGPEGDTRWNLKKLYSKLERFKHYDADIRDRSRILRLVKELRPDVIVHSAAQPSHDLAALRPFDDFDVNAVGTLNLIEASRRYVPDAVFVHMSTNKVYGDAPNRVKMKELDTRWEYDEKEFLEGIPETFPIDQSKHSLFGASKLSSDILVQEYGRYFGMKTCCLRGGCLTGPNHSGVELHGFLSYLVQCNLEGKKYTVFGYKGKQVRDNIHSFDVARFIEAFIENPKSAEVYNIGGGKNNTCSIIEAFEIVSGLTGKKMVSEYIDQNREGDHICYYSDLRKAKEHYPSWDISVSLETIFEQIVQGFLNRKIGTK